MAMFLFAFICASCIGGLIFGAAWLMQKIDENKRR